MKGSWLPLTEYSTKHKVSVSTLRRRIKAEDIQFAFEDGKYLILDEPPTGSAPRPHRPSLSSEKAPEATSLVGSTDRSLANRLGQKDVGDEPILLAANKLLNELKRAYTQILHEKEEQILHLKEEISDLKTLVRVLESENDRLQR